MTSVKKRFGLQVIVSNAEITVHLVLSMVLARLLRPEDIGVFSMSAVLVAVAHVFRDFGVSAFIKRQKTLDQATLRAALGVVMTTSWLVAALMFISAPLWASFFKEPRVEEVVHVLALGFMLIPVGAIPGAILIRDMEVQQTAKATAIALTVYVTVSITLAMHGFDHMTMAWANFFNIATHVTALRLLSRKPTPWIPSFKGWKQVANFGVGSIVTSALISLDNALPDILLGRMSNASAVAYFSRAYSTVNIGTNAVMPAVNYFALPQMARLHHANADIAAAVCRATSYLITVLMPAMVMIALLAREIILLLYGEQWLPSVDAVRWLCISGAITVIFAFSPPALTGIGKPYVAGLPLFALVLLKVVLAMVMFDGTLVSFAHAMVAAQVLALPVYLWIIRRFLGITLHLWLRTVLPVTGISLVLGAAMWLVKLELPELRPSVTLLLMGLIAAPLWLGLIWLTRVPLKQEFESLLATWRLRTR